MKIAVEGCCHGELDKIYETIEYLEQKNNVKMDLLIICGDFQAARNKSDMLCMAVPEKYREMKTFHKYYSGEKTAPLLTIFVGGNHEASNYLQELPYGGWVAPNIYYMGYANVIQVGGVRIAGCSGIYKGHNAQRGHFEHPPYTEDAKRSAYHVRALEIFRLKQISRPIDIFVSHDWPRNIWKYGNVQALLKRKPDFQKDMDDNRLGNPFHEELLYHLKPKYWFAAHLHIKFPAAVLHESNDGESKITKFLSLDKCLPRRKFLQVLDVPHDTEKPISIQLDPEWLAILKSTNHLLNLKTSHKYLPGPGGKERWNFKVKHEEMNAIIEDFGEDLAIPENFKQTVDVYDPSERNPSLPKTMINPQTSLICEMLDITDPNAVFLGKDTKFNLTVDDCIDDSVEGENDDEDDDVDDDTEFESFMSYDQSDQSLSFLSSSNADDSIVSLGVSMNASVDEKDKVSSLNDSFANEDIDEEAKAITEDQKPDQSIDKSTSPSKSSLSQSDVEDIDPELQEILAEQKAKRQLKLTKDSGQVELALTESDDEELASMLAEQKKAQSVQDVSLNESVTHDLSVNDPPSLISEDTLPLSQSSPASSGERSDSEVVKATHGLVLSEDKETRKRGDGSETEESPQSKKFRRRNQSLYESGSEMSS